MKCLKIKDKWIELILSGQKTWEIRRTNTNIRGRIALGNTKTKQVEGYADLIDSFEMTVKELKKHNDKHRANEFPEGYAKETKTLFVWVLKDVEKELEPYPYSFSTGSWCKAERLEPEPDFESEENLESLGYPSSAIQDEEDTEEDP